MVELISNKGTNGEPLTDTNGDPIQDARIIAYHTGGEYASDGNIYTTTTDSNGEYAFADTDLPATGSSSSPPTDYVHLFAEIGSGSSPRQATPIRPWQGYSLQTTIGDYITNRWKHDEGSGTTLGDARGSQDASINGATWVTGSGGNGDAYLNYDGSNDQSRIGPNSHFNPDNFSWMGWINPDSLGQDKRLIDKLEVDGVSMLILSIGGFNVSTDNLGVAIFDADGINNPSLETSNISTGTWHFFGVSADYNNNFTLYIASKNDSDITTVGSKTYTNNRFANTDPIISFGSFDDGGGATSNHYDGQYDDILYAQGTALSKSQMQTVFDVTKGNY